MADPDELLVRNVEKAIRAHRQHYGPARTPTCCESTLESHGNPFRTPRLPEAATSQLLSLMAGKVFSDWRGELEYALARCESPIEELLLHGLAVEALTVAELVAFGPKPVAPFSAFGAVCISPQIEVGKYLIDFQVDMWTWEITESSKTDRWHHAALLVECDGHDFHERTKEQASRDKERDRNLQASGFKIYRYTGSDIWRDCLKAAKEILSDVELASQVAVPLETRERKRKQ